MAGHWRIMGQCQDDPHGCLPFHAVFVHLIDRLSRRPHRHRRRGRCRHRLPGTASRVLFACPAPSAKGSRGLQDNSNDHPLMVESHGAYPRDFLNFFEGAVPATGTQQERREKLTQLVAIL
eukprot:526959-Pyramimonas_sp.AAC.1